MAKQHRSSNTPQGSPRKGATGGEAVPRPGRRRKTWYQTHGRDLRFLGVFAALMGLYMVVFTMEGVKEGFVPWWLEMNARASDSVLSPFFPEMERHGNALVSPHGSISVERGCDALAPCALFVCAVLASPTSLISRLWAAPLGAALLLLVNLIRIISLFVTAVYWQAAFEIMHLEVWQAFFIFLAILFWALWASWERRRKRPPKLQADVPV